MKIAYLIIAHKDFDLLCRTVNVLAHKDVTFIIHIDAKCGTSFDKISSGFDENAQVYFLQEQLEVTWGGFNMLYATVLLLKTAVNIGNFDYVSLISGQDFPLKSSYEIIRFLHENKGTEFLNYHPFPYEKWADGGHDRYKYFWLVDKLGLDLSYIFAKIQADEKLIRRFPEGLVPYGGSMWLTITLSCAKYICGYLDQHNEIFNFFKFTIHPDELAIPTIIMNSAYRDRVVDNNLRYIDWSERKPNPKTLTIEDLDKILASGNHFARKFDSQIDRFVIDTLEGLIIN